MSDPAMLGYLMEVAKEQVRAELEKIRVECIVRNIPWIVEEVRKTPGVGEEEVERISKSVTSFLLQADLQKSPEEILRDFLLFSQSSTPNTSSTGELLASPSMTDIVPQELNKYEIPAADKADLIVDVVPPNPYYEQSNDYTDRTPDVHCDSGNSSPMSSISEINQCQVSQR